jgi:hypothetical protein
MEQFVDRTSELDRLERLYESDTAELAVVYGRHHLVDTIQRLVALLGLQQDVILDELLKIFLRGSEPPVSTRSQSSVTCWPQPVGVLRRLG